MEDVGDTVFVAHEEARVSQGSRKVLKVYLVDKAGVKHLAATGEDLGDAHYHYRSTRPFAKYGTVDCHNRKELTMWLEMVISESGGKQEGAHMAADEQHPEGVYFTQYKYERAHYPDGRRCNRWYLVDQCGGAHLAVIGIERDTKDGHYAYSAEEPFSSLVPLQCSNQQGVYKWLEKMITHHTGGGAAAAAAAMAGGGAGAGAAAGDAAPAASAGSAGGAPAAAGDGGRKPPLVIHLSTIRSARKSAAALASLEQAVVVEANAARPKPKPKTPSAPSAAAAAAASASASAAAASTVGKHKAVGIVQQIQIKKARKLQEDVRAEEERLQSGHLARLRRAAAAEVHGDAAAKAATLGWLHGGITEEEGDNLDHWVKLLNTLMDLQEQQQQQQQQQQGEEERQQQQQRQQPGAEGAEAPPAVDGDMLVWVVRPANAQHRLRVALEALKELAASDLPARVLLVRKIIPTVQRCLAWPHPAVAALAGHMLARWRWQLAGHMHVASCPAYMQDHAAALEEDIAYGLVPLPQLPKHKQALLQTPVPKLPPTGSCQTPAPPAKQPGAPLQQAPASAPAAVGMSFVPGQMVPAFAGFGSNGGFVSPGGALAPGGLFTPMAAAQPQQALGLAGIRVPSPGGGLVAMPAGAGGLLYALQPVPQDAAAAAAAVASAVHPGGAAGAMGAAGREGMVFAPPPPQQQQGAVFVADPTAAAAAYAGVTWPAPGPGPGMGSVPRPGGPGSTPQQLAHMYALQQSQQLHMGGALPHGQQQQQAAGGMQVITQLPPQPMALAASGAAQAPGADQLQQQQQQMLLARQYQLLNWQQQQQQQAWAPMAPGVQAGGTQPAGSQGAAPQQLP